MEYIKEITPQVRKQINQKKNYGLKKEINEYTKDIINTFYNEALLTEKLNNFISGKEDFTNVFNLYLSEVSKNLNELMKKAKEHLTKVWLSGNKRVFNDEGENVTIEETEDTQAIEYLVNKQTEYYKNLSQRQSRLVDKEIVKGLKKGLSNEQIANNIKQISKRITTSSALRIARTEILNAHTLSQLETMKKAGGEYYSIITSENYIGKDGHKYPCKVCRKLSGPRGKEYIYNLNEAGNRENPTIPLHSHPSCNCLCVLRTKR